ncbi:MAG: alpha/beta fold hydrolase [Candidatus Aenigmatarchaeota archaeon]
MKEINVIFKNKGQKIIGVLHIPKKQNPPAIVMCHGFTGNKGDIHNKLYKAAKKFCENGFVVLRFDFRGSGESEGEFVNVTISSEVSDLKIAIGFMQKQGYKRIGVVGSSLGGTISLIGFNERIKAMVLWNPVTNLRQTFIDSDLIPKENAQRLEKNGFIIFKDNRTGKEFKIGKKFWKEIETLDVVKYLKRLKCPVLILHGNKDTVVPLKQSENAMKIIGSEIKELRIINGAEHGFHKASHEKQVIDLTLNWFNKWLK